MHRRHLICLHFHFQKHHSHFPFSFPTSVEHFYFLFSVYETLNRYTIISLFLARVPKHNFHVFVRSLTSKNDSVNFFLVYFFLNMFCLPFSSILTSKCINDSYVLGIYTVSTATTPYFFLYMSKKCNISLSWYCLAFKTLIIPFFLLRIL